MNFNDLSFTVLFGIVKMSFQNLSPINRKGSSPVSSTGWFTNPFYKIIYDSIG